MGNLTIEKKEYRKKEYQLISLSATDDCDTSFGEIYTVFTYVCKLPDDESEKEYMFKIIDDTRHKNEDVNFRYYFYETDRDVWIYPKKYKLQRREISIGIKLTFEPFHDRGIPRVDFNISECISIPKEKYVSVLDIIRQWEKINKEKKKK